VSVPTNEKGLLRFDAHGTRIAFVSDQEDGNHMLLYDRATRCTTVLDDFTDTALGFAYGHDPSIEGVRVAYVATWIAEADDVRTRVLQLRLADIESRARRVLIETRSRVQRDRSGGMDFITMRYPWIVWSDERESNWYRWDAYAFNVDTGEERNLSVNSVTGERQWGSVVRVDLLGTLAVFDSDWGGGSAPLFEEVVSVDLESGERRQITTSAGSQWNPTITPRWIAWLDQRDYPRCVGGEVCSTDVWGLDRSTGVEQALVVAGNSMQGRELDGEGDWLVYEDQRDGTDVTREWDREQEIYAFHLPTMTEIRITDWPGYKMLPRAYAREGGTFGVLFVEEISYAPAIYRLWDCGLPTPGGSG
jgi:Tol biopolymer transport system component